MDHQQLYTALELIEDFTDSKLRGACSVYRRKLIIVAVSGLRLLIFDLENPDMSDADKPFM